MGRLKGVSWVSLREFIKERGGEGALGSVMTLLSEADREVWRAPILTSSWVDYGPFIRAAFAVDRALGSGDGVLVRQAAVFSARRDLGGIYRMFVSLSSPQFAISRAAKLWRQYFDSGEMVVVAKSNTHVVLHLSDFSNMPDGHEVFLQAYMEELIRLSGGKEPRSSHPTCLSRGDSYCTFAIEWS